VWKNRRGWGDYLFIFFSKFVRYEVGDGFKIQFWYDVWCRD